MPRKPITVTNVDDAQPAKQQYVIWDDGGKETVKGFGLLVMPSGRKTYIFQYRGPISRKLERWTIGRHGDVSTYEARGIAKKLWGQVANKLDPCAEKRAEREASARQVIEAAQAEAKARDLAFDAYVDRWLEEGWRDKKRKIRSGTETVYRGSLKNHAVPILGSKPLPDITREDIRALLKAVPANQPSVARLLFAALRGLFTWALKQDDLAKSPLEGLDGPEGTEARDRVLTSDELALVLRAAANLPSPIGPFYRALAMTGQRREEVARMNWLELDRATATWTIPADRAKNRKAHLVPLAPALVELLDGLAGVDPKANEKSWPKRGFLFQSSRGTAISGFSKAKRLIDQTMLELARADAEKSGADPQAVEVEQWRLHDLRRTMATNFQEMGVRFEVTEAVLNHVSGARSGVAGIYQRYDWAREKREALEAWAERCTALVEPAAKKTNVVPIGARKRSV